MFMYVLQLFVQNQPFWQRCSLTTPLSLRVDRFLIFSYYTIRRAFHCFVVVPGSDEMDLPVITKILLIFWGFSLLFWLANRVFYHKSANRLNDIVVVGPVAQVLVVLFDYLQFIYRSQHGTPNDGYENAQKFFSMANSSMLFLSCLLAVHG